MPRFFVRETFFRPPVFACERSALPAALYNDLQLLLSRSESESLFIPIRAMQFQAAAAQVLISLPRAQPTLCFDGPGAGPTD